MMMVRLGFAHVGATFTTLRVFACYSLILMSNGVYSIVPVRNRQGQHGMPFHGVHIVQHRLRNINYSVCICWNTCDQHALLCVPGWYVTLVTVGSASWVTSSLIQVLGGVD